MGIKFKQRLQRISQVLIGRTDISAEDAIKKQEHKIVTVQPVPEEMGKNSHREVSIEKVDASTIISEPTQTLPRCPLPKREESSEDVPKIDAGVRMLCMDGGGAKGVIEATILDKIFCSVAVTLKYEVHVLNWLTLVIDKSQVKTMELKYIYKTIISRINMPEASLSGYLKTTKQYKQVQTIDRTKDFSDKKGCIVISGLITESGFFKPLTHEQKCKILSDETLRKINGVEVKDFLHGASKYWVFLNSDQSDETRDKIIADVSPAFNSKAKCVKMLMPAVDLVLKKSKENTRQYDGRDLLVFYWEEPVKTKHSLVLQEKLLRSPKDDYTERYAPEQFFVEIKADEMFDLMIGTSTGSILAFGMGYKGLSPQECRDVYLKSIKRIFSSKYDRSTTGLVGLADTAFRTVGDLLGQGHYSIDGVSDTLEENYNIGRPTRTKMGGGENRTSCICACVALNWEEQNLEVFDTHNPKYKDWDLIQFLTASSDAPVYFTTPYEVRGPDDSVTKYIDGGLGANCPAKQGIELAKRRWKGAEIELIVSVGAGKDKHPPAVPQKGGDWLKTLCSMVTDGDSIWQNFVIPMLSIDEACKNTEHIRIQPKMELAQFKADSTKVIEMCNLAESWLNTETGFLQVTEACGKIVAKSMKLSVESRILTERDLMDWIASTLPIGKTLFKNKIKNRMNKTMDKYDDQAQGITNDSLDMKFGRELHSLFITPCDKLKDRFPAIDQNFLYIPKPVSVAQTDLRFTMKFDHHSETGYADGHGEQVLKLHCPDNHEVNIIANIDVFETDRVYKVSGLVTVPLTETEQFHRLVHEASKEISQLLEEDRCKAEEKLAAAMQLEGLPELVDIHQKYMGEHFMRIQAYFYLWKRNTKEVSLRALNETLIQVGMKRRPWPKRARLGEPDVTVRTVIPAPPENMMFGIAVEYFNDKYEKAADEGDKESQTRYAEFMRHLGVHPALKQSENSTFKKKFLKTVFRNRKDSKLTDRSKTSHDLHNVKYKNRVTREDQDISPSRNVNKNRNKSMFGKSIFGRTKKSNQVPKKFGQKWRANSASRSSRANKE